MAKKQTSSTTGRKRSGPPPERLKIDGDWKDAVRTALKAKPKRRPAAPRHKP